jgi:hypothetical protein
LAAIPTSISIRTASHHAKANGWEASLSGNANRWFAIEGDASGYYKSSILGFAVSVTDYSFAAGPRFNFKPFFVHALLG